MNRPLTGRVAAAPISWGVCEVPGWGLQLDPDTVLSQMHEIGLAATEFGPAGFLPESPEAKSAVLRSHGLAAVGQFVPVVLHDPGFDPVPGLEREMDALRAAGADTVVIAAVTGADGYDSRPELDDAGWELLLARLDLIDARAAGRGLRLALHPHVGTMIESAADTLHVLTGSTAGLCLDTGHLLIGGGDPVAIARDWGDRVRHTHLKDVRLDVADRVRSGELTYTEAVAAGMYVPLGTGDVAVGTIIDTLEAGGYDGWYVLERDTILTAEPTADDSGPMGEVRRSYEFVLARST